MKIFVILALCACAFADETIVEGGIEGHEIIPPPPGFEGIKGLTGLVGLTTGLGESRLGGEEPTPITVAAIPRGEHFVDAPIYSSPPLSIVDKERIDLVPTSNYYNHGNKYVIVPPSRSQALSSPLNHYLHGTPSSGQYLYSPTPVHSGVVPTPGYQYVYSPSVHSEVVPSVGHQYVYSPSVHPEVVPSVGHQYVYGAPSVHSGLYNTVPVSGSPYLYSPSVPVTGEQYVNYYVPEVEHREHTVLRAPTPNHPRNGASVYYAKWQ